MSKNFIYALILIPVLTGISKSAEVGFNSYGAGFDASLVIPDGSLHPTPGFGGFMDFGFGIGTAGSISIHPNIELWISGYDFNGRYGEGHTRLFETAFNGDVRYYPPIPERVKVRPFVGNGLAILLAHNNTDYTNDNFRDYENTNTSAGFDIFGGIDFPLTNKADGFVEIKGKLGDYDLVKFTFGMNFHLGS